MSQTDVVALLVTDLVGSTELHTSLGEEAGGELRRAHDRVLVDAVSSHGGKVVKGLGDGIMAAFDGAADALAAAVSMQQGIERLSRRSSALSMRVGLSVGDVTWDDADCFGVTVIEATRLCQAAEGGQILAADLVRAIARGRGGYEFNPVGSLSLKGLPEPVGACRVVWAPVEGPAWPVPLPVRLRVPEGSFFVGRAGERSAVAECLKRVGGDDGRVLAFVEGEAGIGKTALVSAVARDAHAEGALVLYGRSDEALGIPYQPWVEALADLVED
jgi:class 3 adenylate cyclase